MAAQCRSILDGEASGEDVALDNRCTTECDEAGGANLAIDTAQDNNVLGDDRGANVAFGTDGEAGTLKADNAVYFTVNRQVFRAGKLSANLCQRADNSLALGRRHRKVVDTPGQWVRLEARPGASPTIPKYAEGKQSAAVGPECV